MKKGIVGQRMIILVDFIQLANGQFPLGLNRFVTLDIFQQNLF